MVKHILLTSFFCVVVSFVFAQQSLVSDSVIYVYDTVYVPVDTVAEVYEVVEYEYVDPLFSYAIGCGLGYNLSTINNNSEHFVSHTLAVPVTARMLYSNYFIQLTAQYSPITFSAKSVFQTQDLSTRDTMLTIFVDSIYKIIDGVKELEIITKEEKSTYIDTVYTDSAVVENFNYSIVELPLTVGYGFQHKQFSFSASAGASLSFVLGEKRYFDKKYFLSYCAELVAGYSLSKYLAIELGVKSSMKASQISSSHNSFVLFARLLYSL